MLSDRRSDLRNRAEGAAQDVALAALIGGNLFGRLAMNPALESVSDRAQRGKVLNRAWRRYGTVNSVALLTLLGTWLSERASDGRLRPRDRRLAQAKDIATGAVVLTGLASAAGGVRFAQQAPGGAVPMESGTEAGAEAPGAAVELKRAVNALGALNLAAELALAVVNASRDS